MEVILVKGAASIPLSKVVKRMIYRRPLTSLFLKNSRSE